MFVAKDTIVVVQTTEGMSSYAAHEGEPMHYEVAQDVIVNGYLIAKAGDDADGIVMEAQQGRTGYYGIGYKAADLRISVEELHNYCGDSLKLRFIRTEYRQREGLFGSKKDVDIKDHQKYATRVAFPQKVCGTATSEVDPPLTDDVIQPDKP